MALATGTIWEMKTTATASNVNGAGFNTANANFLTDLACDANTGNTTAPVVSSASYNFVAGDVGAYVYIKSGTNWTPGFYKISSVASNKATLDATIGSAEQLVSGTFEYSPSTVVGCATVGTPTGGTFGIDYSRLDAAINTATNLASTSGTTNPSVVTSATVTFAANHVGNIIHITAGTSWTAGWYEIVSVSGGAATLDRAVGSSATLSNGTFYVGGAGILTALEDAFYEMLPAGSLVYYRGSGTHTLTGAITIVSTKGTSTSPIWSIGYTTVRGDTTNDTARPLLAAGSNAVTFGQYMNFKNLRFSTSAAPGIVSGTGSIAWNCACRNTSSTTTRAAFNGSANTDLFYFLCVGISQNGKAFQIGGSRNRIIGCAARFSQIGLDCTVNGLSVSNMLFEGCTTAGIQNSAISLTVNACTFYGREGKIGIGVSNTSSSSNYSDSISNSIFYGLVTGISGTTTNLQSNISFNNNFYNNTTDVTLWNKGINDYALDPTFTGASQITGTTGYCTATTQTLTDANADFSSVEDGVDFLYVASGTGATVGMYLIASHTTTTLVTAENTLGTHATADRVYYVWSGHNLGIGTNLKAKGVPGAMPLNGSTDIPTSYLDIGAVQRQEPASSGSTGFFIS